MTVYRNRNFTKRNYEFTNVVACESAMLPTFGWSGQPADYWEPADKSLLTGLAYIGTLSGVAFYGHL